MFCASSLSQPPDTLWTRAYGGSLIEMANSIQQTHDGGYVMAGTVGFSDYYVVKVDSLGYLQWSSTYGDYGTEGAKI